MDLVFKWNVLIISTLKLCDVRDSGESSVNTPPSAQGLWSWQRIDPHVLLLKPLQSSAKVRPSISSSRDEIHNTTTVLFIFIFVFIAAPLGLHGFYWWEKVFRPFVLVDEKLKRDFNISHCAFCCWLWAPGCYSLIGLKEKKVFLTLNPIPSIILTVF